MAATIAGAKRLTIRRDLLPAVLLILAVSAAAIDPPVWPDAYEVSYVLSLGYVDSLQPSGLKYPVHVWYDNPGKQMRVTFYNGLDETYVMPGMTYQVFPRITTKTCWAMNTTTGPTVPGSPTSSGNSDGGSDSRRAGRSRSEQQGPGPLDLYNPEQWLQDEDLPPPLPSLAGWTYSGTARLPSRPPSHVWQLTQRVQDKVNTYTWHVGQKDGRPLALYMLGVNLLTGSHYDQYTLEFEVWVPGAPAPRFFKPPAHCDDVDAPQPGLLAAGLGMAAARAGATGVSDAAAGEVTAVPAARVAAGASGAEEVVGRAGGAVRRGVVASAVLQAHSVLPGALLAGPTALLALQQQTEVGGSTTSTNSSSSSSSSAASQAGGAVSGVAPELLRVQLARKLAAVEHHLTTHLAMSSSSQPSTSTSISTGSSTSTTSTDSRVGTSISTDSSTSSSTQHSPAAAADLAFIQDWNRRQLGLRASALSTSTSSSSTRGGLEAEAEAEAKAEAGAGAGAGAGPTGLRAGAGASGAGAAGTQAGPSLADSFLLAPNKWLGVGEQVWRATALGRLPGSSRRRVTARPSGRHLGQFQRRLSDAQLPTSVDWRGTGADGPVKDQASCGSCWAFATTGAMTGAWFLATGQSISLSEQQIVDCSWDHEVNGCSGGWVENALEYISLDAGGAVQEADYPYMGQNAYCRANKHGKAAAFSGYLTLPEGDEGAMMEAVATHGPIAIAFDANHPTFKYYSEGVYYRADCGHDADHLDHAVTLVGYGTTEAGTDYWLLRNSWSLLWGDNGYFKMARKGNDCGVTIDGVVAVVDTNSTLGQLRPGSAGAVAVAAARRQALRY